MKPPIGWTARRSPWLAACLICCPGMVRGDGPRPGEAATLRDAIRAQVTAELTGRWYPAALDRERGGFRQNLARDWSPRRTRTGSASTRPG